MSEELEPIAEENSESLYEKVAFTVDKGQAPMRIDKWVQARIEGITRNKLQNGIDAGFLTVNGKVVKSNYKTRPGDEVVYLSIINPEASSSSYTNLFLNLCHPQFIHSWVGELLSKMQPPTRYFVESGSSSGIP